MSDHNLEVRQSKTMTVLACISAVILVCVFTALTVFFIVKLTTEHNLTFDDNVTFIFSAVTFAIFAAIIGIILGYILHTYKYQVDIYTDNTLIRKKKDKIIFELPYENIVSVRKGWNLIAFMLKSPIVRKDGKKGPRNFFEHYSEADIIRIMQIVGSPREYN